MSDDCSDLFMIFKRCNKGHVLGEKNKTAGGFGVTEQIHENNQATNKKTKVLDTKCH